MPARIGRPTRARFSVAAFAVAALFFAPACSYTFDADAPSFSLGGAPVVGTHLASVSDLDTLRLVEDEGGAPWLAVFRAASGRGLPDTVRLVQLDPPFAEQRFTADRIHVRRRALYLVDDGPTATSPARLRVQSPGAAAFDTFAMPPGDEVLLSAPGDVAFVYYVLGADTFVLQRRDGGGRRTLPAYTSDSSLSFLAPVLLGGPAFDDRGDLLLHRSDTCQDPGQPPGQDAENGPPKGPPHRPPGRCRPAVAVHATREARDLLLADLDRDSFVALAPAAEGAAGPDLLVECGASGLHVRPIAVGPALSGGRVRLLDGTPDCTPLFASYGDLAGVAARAPWIQGQKAYYRTGAPHLGHAIVLRVVPLDESAPPRVILEGTEKRVLALHTGTDRVLYTLDPYGTWAGDASDGWIGDARFMERGLSAGFSRDGTRVRWLEHAANFSLVATGELRGIDLTDLANLAGDDSHHPGPLHLAENVAQFHELPDGRVVAAANHAFLGAHNRIILLDEKTRTARLLAEHAPSYLEIPGTPDIIAVELDGQGGYDLVRIPIPPRE